MQHNVSTLQSTGNALNLTAIESCYLPNRSWASSFCPCLESALHFLHRIYKIFDFAHLVPLRFFTAQWQIVDSSTPCVNYWSSIVQVWCQVMSSGFSFCSCYKTGCHLKLDFFNNMNFSYSVRIQENTDQK